MQSSHEVEKRSWSECICTTMMVKLRIQKDVPYCSKALVEFASKSNVGRRRENFFVFKQKEAEI
jgi:hypothetical protein